MKIEKAIDVLKRFRIATVSYSVDGDRVLEPLDMAISALEKQIELNDYLNTLRKNKKYQIYDILSEFALEVEDE